MNRAAILVPCLALACSAALKSVDPLPEQTNIRTAESSPSGAGKRVSNAEPSSDGSSDASTPDSSAPTALEGADEVIAGLRTGFKSCYNKGLSADPKMEGRIVLSIKVTPEGNIDSVTKLGGAGLSPEVEACIMRVAGHPTFSPSKGATIQLPVSFVQTKP